MRRTFVAGLTGTAVGFALPGAGAARDVTVTVTVVGRPTDPLPRTGLDTQRPIQGGVAALAVAALLTLVLTRRKGRKAPIRTAKPQVL